MRVRGSWPRSPGNVSGSAGRHDRRAPGGRVQEGGLQPQLVVLAVARVAGELGAGIAQAGGMDVGEILADVTEVVRKAGRAVPSLGRAALSSLALQAVSSRSPRREGATPSAAANGSTA